MRVPTGELGIVPKQSKADPADHPRWVYGEPLYDTHPIALELWHGDQLVYRRVITEGQDAQATATLGYRVGPHVIVIECATSRRERQCMFSPLLKVP